MSNQTTTIELANKLKLCVTIKHKKQCIFKGCKKRPNFGFKNGNANFCAEHKQQNMIDVVNKRCKHEGCNKHPAFGFENGDIEYCNEHKQQNMINVLSKRCKHDGCNKQPNFGFENGNADFCAEHKQQNMIDVKHKKLCKHDGCNKRPVFGFENGDADFCAEHKQQNMIDVLSKRCLYKGCKKHPAFGFENGDADFCAEHKQQNMINVLSKRCKHEGCNKRPNFGFENGDADFCAEHKQQKMIDIKNKKCKHEGCKKQPAFGFENGDADFCAEHKQHNMIDVKTKRCKTNLCPIRVNNKKYRGYCLRCFIYTFPDEPVARNYKTKERSVFEFLCNDPALCDKTIINDKRIPDGCSQRRPDIYMDFGSHIIIIEIDENQHVDYDSNCEKARLNELSTDCGFRPIIMIRFNPDKYTAGNEKIPSCWMTNRNGILTVSKTRQNMWKNRLFALRDTVLYYSCADVAYDGEILKIISLFYNQ
jgi:hypothetical protein